MHVSRFTSDDILAHIESEVHRHGPFIESEECEESPDTIQVFETDPDVEILAGVQS